jgi:fructokinase
VTSPCDSLPLLAGVELGGTKCVCILGSGPERILAEERIPTTDPATTLGAIEAVLDRWRAEFAGIAALGIASFGPLDLDPRSPRHGSITSTVKPGWRDTPVGRRLAPRLDLPWAIDTDVNGAALAEGRWGGARGLEDFAYVTVGTGIGVGLVVGGRTVHGLGHPELGHVRVVRTPGDTWGGNCAFHGDCVEGIASGSAIGARPGTEGARDSPDHPVWQPVGDALAQLLHVVVLATAPRRILMGGGVMDSQPHLFERVRAGLKSSLNLYVEAPELGAGLAAYVVPPGLGPLAGPLGALAVAATAL